MLHKPKCKMQNHKKKPFFCIKNAKPYLLEDNLEEDLNELDLGDDVTDMTPKTQSMKLISWISLNQKLFCEGHCREQEEKLHNEWQKDTSG